MMRDATASIRPGVFIDGASALLGLTERTAFSVLGPRHAQRIPRGVWVEADPSSVVHLETQQHQPRSEDRKRAAGSL